MPRRLITSQIWLNERVAQLPDPGRLLFIGIFSNADDDGRLKASPAYLKALIFPYDDKTKDNIQEWRDLCVKLGLIRVYNLNGIEYLDIPSWLEHQLIRKDRYKPSTLPSFPDGSQPAPTCQPTDNQLTTTGLRKISKVKLSKDNIILHSKELKFPPEFIKLRKQVFEGLKTRREYKSPNPAKEVQAINWMLKEGFAPDQILTTYDKMKKDRFWQDKHLDMQSVKKQIGQLIKGKAKKRDYGHQKFGDLVEK